MKALGWSWGQVSKLTADRTQWSSSVSALCASSTKRTRAKGRLDNIVVNHIISY